MKSSFRISYRDNVTHVPKRLRIRANPQYKLYYYREGADPIRFFIDGAFTELNVGEAVLIPTGSFTGCLKRNLARYVRCVSLFDGSLAELIRSTDPDIGELLDTASVFTLTDEVAREYANIISSLSQNSAVGIYAAEMILKQLRMLKECKRRRISRPNENGLVGSIIKAINEECLMPDATDRISSRLGYSKGYLSKCFKAKMSVGLHDFITAKRLLAALNMLTNGRSVTDTAYSCGFSGTSHFISAFRAHYGDTPKKYMKKITEI